MQTGCRAAVVAFGLLTADAAAAADQRPNILLIVADDAGYTDIGAFGGEIHTPNLDALAAVGVRFTQFTASATCSPSRSMLLSGTDNHLAGLGNMAEFTAPNQVGQPGYEGHLKDRAAPLRQLLAAAGHDTFVVGKGHLGEEPAQRPAARDLALIPGSGSHLDDMWGAVGERQLYTFSGEPLRALGPGFHSSVD
jgi:arylsulfatase